MSPDLTQPRRSGRPSQSAAAALPERILASARELFLERGFAATSLQQIAAHAGATKRTLYVKIGDKEALFTTVVTDMLGDWRNAVAAVPATGSLQHRLEQIGLDLLAVLLAPDLVRLTRVLVSEAYRFPALVQLLMRQVEEGPVPKLARLLMEQRGAATTPSREDEVAARLLYEMIGGQPLRVALTGPELAIDVTREEWVHDVVTLFLQGWRETLGSETA